MDIQIRLLMKRYSEIPFRTENNAKGFFFNVKSLHVKSCLAFSEIQKHKKEEEGAEIFMLDFQVQKWRKRYKSSRIRLSIMV